MASVGLGGGFKPLPPSKIKMDTSQAMAMMGFASSQAFEHTSLEEIEAAFMSRVYQLEIAVFNKKDQVSRKTELRHDFLSQHVCALFWHYFLIAYWTLEVYK